MSYSEVEVGGGCALLLLAFAVVVCVGCAVFAFIDGERDGRLEVATETCVRYHADSQRSFVIAGDTLACINGKLYEGAR